MESHKWWSPLQKGKLTVNNVGAAANNLKIQIGFSLFFLFSSAFTFRVVSQYIQYFQSKVQSIRVRCPLKTKQNKTKQKQQIKTENLVSIVGWMVVCNLPISDWVTVVFNLSISDWVTVCLLAISHWVKACNLCVSDSVAVYHLPISDQVTVFNLSIFDWVGVYNLPNFD